MTPFAVLFAASLAVPAQSAPVDPFGGSAAAVSKAMQEDVETMRYVLARKLGPFASGSQAWAGTMWNTHANPVAPLGGLAAQGYAAPGGTNLATTDYALPYYGRGYSAAVEGLYLSRVGVLFTVTLPPTKGDPRLSADAPTKAEPVSEWERAKMAMEGKTPPASQPTARRETPLAEVLLRTMADNGKHFRDLRDDERVVIVATFRKSADGSDPFAHGSLLGLYTAAAGQRAVTATAPVAPGQSPAMAGGAAGDADYDALAELHLKRGDHARAIEAYEANAKRAVKESETAADAAGSAAALKRARAAYARLTQAYTLAGQYDHAKTAMDLAQKTQDAARRLEERGRDTTPATTKPTAPPLPARLTVSATKRDLVAAAAGKLSIEELRKAASVEYSDPAATK